MTGKGRLFSQWQPQQEMLETPCLSYFPVDARQKVGEQEKRDDWDPITQIFLLSDQKSFHAVLVASYQELVDSNKQINKLPGRKCLFHVV